MRFMIMHKVTDEMEKGLPPDPEIIRGVDEIITQGLAENAFIARPDGGESAVEAGRSARVGRISPAIGHVDDDQRRALAEAESTLEDAALLVVGIHSGHRRSQAFHRVHRQRPHRG